MLFSEAGAAAGEPSPVLFGPRLTLFRRALFYTVISTIGRAATILALCLSLGFHWLALQSVAWTTMLVANVRHETLSQAVAKTFDGGHPCDLCHAVAEGKKSEKKSEILPAIAKVDLICTRRTLSYLPPWIPYDYPPLSCAIPERVQTPLVPPPRLLPG